MIGEREEKDALKMGRGDSGGQQGFTEHKASAERFRLALSCKSWEETVTHEQGITAGECLIFNTHKNWS